METGNIQFYPDGYPVMPDDYDYRDWEFRHLATPLDDIQKTLNQWRHIYFLRLIPLPPHGLLVARKKMEVV